MNYTINDAIPILNIIDKIKDKPNKYLSFIEEIKKKDSDDKKLYPLAYKEDDELILIYSTDDYVNDEGNNNDKINSGTRCVILEKKTLKPILTQYNKIVYNEDADKLITNWDNVVIQKCYEGTLISVYYHKKWYVSTRRCLDSKKSIWIKSKSYYEMFEDCIEGKFKLEDLNKDYVYTFVLIHNQNSNIINYSTFMGESYKEIYHTLTTTKYDCLEIDYKINDNVLTPEEYSFESKEIMYSNLYKLSQLEKECRRIQYEGYIVKHYYGKKQKSYFQLLKFQTDLYKELFSLKPNNSNKNQCYLELYQKDKLQDYLPYITSYHFDIIKRINNSMKTISKELLTIYHSTRKKKNPGLYEALKDTYKKVIYELHGFYIENRKKEFNIVNNSNQKFKAISIHNVYHHIKSLDIKQLVKLYYERYQMLDDSKINNYLISDCIYTKTQTLLMFEKKNLLNFVNNSNKNKKITSKNL